MYVSEPDDLTAWRERVAAFVTGEFGVDYFREKYREREYPHELYDAVVDRGWLGVQVPETYGGQGRSHVEMAVLLEELGSYGYDFGMPVLLSTTGVLTLLDHGSEAQCERFVPRLLDGDVRFSIGVTEPQTGSDAAGIETRADRDGDTYRVTGEKTYQSGAAAPGNYVAAYVRTDPDADRTEGLSLLLVPNDAPGVDVETLPLVARKSVGTNRIAFEDVPVPVENRVGDEGEGWSILGDHLTREHTYMAAVMVGNAATAVETATEAVEDRERFGRTVADFQTVKHRLADLQTEVDAARLLVYRAASKLDDGSATRRHASEAKLKAGEVLKEASSESVQLLGGAGLHPDNDVERYWREGASATIAGATSEIHRSIVASHLLE